MCGMRPPDISMQMNTMCTKLSLSRPSILPLSCCTAHRGATVLVLKRRRRARLLLSSSQPQPGTVEIWSGCCHVVAACPHGSFQNRMLKGKVPPKSSSSPFDGALIKERWRSLREKMFTLRSVQGAAFVQAFCQL